MLLVDDNIAATGDDDGNLKVLLHWPHKLFFSILVSCLCIGDLLFQGINI